MRGKKEGGGRVKSRRENGSEVEKVLWSEKMREENERKKMVGAEQAFMH